MLSRDGRDMARKHKTVSVPMSFWLEVEKLYEDMKTEFQALEVSTASELLRVLANLGRKPLVEFLEGKKPLAELLVEAGKLRKKSKETPQKPG